jgi:cytochrome b561
VLLRLIWWLKNQRLKAPEGMPENAYGLSRLTLLFLYIDMLGLGASGFMYSWAMAYEVSIFGLFTLPVLEGGTPALAGYLHSVFLFFNNIMLLTYLVVFVYHGLRYKVGFRRMLPGVHA